MAKTKTSFFCQSCGTQFSKWSGQCTSCHEWNTIVEEIIQKESKREWAVNSSIKKVSKPQRISEIELSEQDRISTKSEELNRVLGGGLVRGSVVLVGGEPGVGKSTLLLQIAMLSNHKILYVSGEESLTQIKMRSERLKENNPNCYVLTETNTQNIFRNIEDLQPEILIIDSIQTLYTDYLDATPGTVSQIRESAAELIKFAKETATPVFLVGHITKDGQLAGPKILEHMVDVVLQFEGDRNHIYRILRVHKNRYGSAAELGIFEMQLNGLREVLNPSEILISQKEESLSGVAIASIVEGARPLMIEVQALVSTAVYGTPQRSSTGYNLKRLNMLLAVLEKRAGFKLGIKDVFLNITGGITVEDPSIDLAVVAAILSSNENESIPQNYCFAAEVGLAGEIRPISRIDYRIKEAEKLGYEKIFVSKYNKFEKRNSSIQIINVSKIEDVFKHLFA
ncbi:MAG: DNA repair protein RadA [Flavobacteriaceae bacterium]|nr:DNA repair protein RadA [Flavobacteriaceae bacterium]